MEKMIKLKEKGHADPIVDELYKRIFTRASNCSWDESIEKRIDVAKDYLEKQMNIVGQEENLERDVGDFLRGQKYLVFSGDSQRDRGDYYVIQGSQGDIESYGQISVDIEQASYCYSGLRKLFLKECPGLKAGGVGWLGLIGRDKKQCEEFENKYGIKLSMFNAYRAGMPEVILFGKATAEFAREVSSDLGTLADMFMKTGAFDKVDL